MSGYTEAVKHLLLFFVMYILVKYYVSKPLQNFALLTGSIIWVIYIVGVYVWAHSDAESMARRHMRIRSEIDADLRNRLYKQKTEFMAVKPKPLKVKVKAGLQALTCPNCSAPLEFEGADFVKCKYCGVEVVKERA